MIALFQYFIVVAASIPHYITKHLVDSVYTPPHDLDTRASPTSSSGPFLGHASIGATHRPLESQRS